MEKKVLRTSTLEIRLKAGSLGNFLQLIPEVTVYTCYGWKFDFDIDLTWLNWGGRSMCEANAKNRLKRRANLLYRLREKGVRVNTKERVFFIMDAGLEWLLSIKQVHTLINEYGFAIQLEF
ncbi:MAG: hypothetical protein LBC40_00935 [Dysgonamonadaceae bacterium]|jgi:hypothetical protein|nr:hypothetical protein [Dysgonamonadaceae bacterium]